MSRKGRVWVPPSIRNGKKVKGYWRKAPVGTGTHEERGGQRAWNMGGPLDEDELRAKRDELRTLLVKPVLQTNREKYADLFWDDGEYNEDELWERSHEIIAEGEWAYFMPARQMRESAYRVLGISVPTTDPHLKGPTPNWGVGRELDQEEADRSAFIMLATLEQTIYKQPKPLYRGVRADYDTRDRMLRTLKPGAVIDMPLVSFTDTKSVTESFGTDIVFKIEKGAQALQGGEMEGPRYKRASDIPHGLRYGYETPGGERVKVGDLIDESLDSEGYYDAWDNDDLPREWVTGGRLRVKSVKEDRSGALHVTLKQVGVFNPLDGSVTTVAKSDIQPWEFWYLFDGSAKALPPPPEVVKAVAVSPTGVRVELAEGTGIADLTALAKEWPLAGFVASDGSLDVPGLTELQKAAQDALTARDGDGDGWVNDGPQQSPAPGVRITPAGMKLWRSVTDHYDEQGTGLHVSQMGESGAGVYTTPNPSFAKDVGNWQDGKSVLALRTTRQLRVIDRSKPEGEQLYRSIQMKDGKYLKGQDFLDAMKDAGYDAVYFPGVTKGDSELVVHDPSALAIEGKVAKGVRYVRTPEGAKKYGVPIGSPIGGRPRASFGYEQSAMVVSRNVPVKGGWDYERGQSTYDRDLTLDVEPFDKEKFIAAATAGAVKLLGLHGTNRYELIPQEGVHGSGYFGPGTYFNAVDPSGMDAQSRYYRGRGTEVLAELTIEKSVIIRGEDIKDTGYGKYENDTEFAVYATVLGIPVERSSEDYSEDDYEKINDFRNRPKQEIVSDIRSRGFDAIVYISDGDAAAMEHGSQIVALDSHKIRVLDQYITDDEFTNIFDQVMVGKSDIPTFDGRGFTLIPWPFRDFDAQDEPVVFTKVEITGPGVHENVYFDGVLDDITKAKSLNPVRIMRSVKRSRAKRTDHDDMIDKLTRSLAKEIRRAVSSITGSPEAQTLVDSWVRGDFSGWHDKLTSAARALRTNPRKIAEGIKDSYTYGMPGPEALAPDDFDPKAVTPQAIRYASTRTGDLLVGMGKNFRNDLTDQVTQTLNGDISQGELARNLRGSLSLSPQQRDSVDKFRAGLQASGVKGSKANAEARAYADRLLMARAETIARTEVMTAYNAGQREYWERQLELGDMPRGTVFWEWSTHPDERTCDVCGPMNGVRSGIGNPFTIVENNGDVRDLMFPPVHPNCRCTLTIAADSPAKLAEALHRSLK